MQTHRKHVIEVADFKEIFYDSKIGKAKQSKIHFHPHDVAVDRTISPLSNIKGIQ